MVLQMIYKCVLCGSADVGHYPCPPVSQAIARRSGVTDEMISSLSGERLPTSSLSGVKHDNSKPELDMVPLAALEGISRALTYGKGKYGKNNYKGGMEWSRVAAALSRHLYKWLDKQELDEESGLNHLDHVAACAAMLLYYKANNVGKDDR